LRKGSEMDIKTLELFAHYNSITNIKINEIILALSTEQWEKEFRGYFNSIKSLCNHIYIADFNWLKRFSDLRKFEYIGDVLFQKKINFTEMIVGTIQDFSEMRNELDKKINAFVSEVRNEDLERKLKYVDSHGKEYERNFGVLILHMFNHETHHRGMISIYLEEMGIANDYSNLIGIL
jgi:uncharacterized damage-inducible protein DinB